MPGTGHVERTDDATVVVQEARGQEAAALRATGERLLAAAHPGVVRVLSSNGGDDHWQLRTAHAGRPLDVGQALAPESLAAVAAATATTLADLHGMGVVHGHLKASHILIGPHGRPVLCGFGADAGGAGPADDVGALGQILQDHLSGQQTAEPIPDRRWSKRRRWDGWARSTLLTLADQACAEPPSRRPSARRFAAAISEAFDVTEPTTRAAVEADESSSQGPDEDPIEALRRTVAAPSPGARPLAWRTAGGAVAIVLGVAVIVHSTPNRSPLTAASTRPPASVAAAAPTSTTYQPTPRPAAPVEDESPRPHRCPGSICTPEEDVQIDGNVVTTRSGRFEVGRSGDFVVVADWDCDGVVTPAVLRPGTGEVFVFPRWSGDAELAVGPVRTVTGGTALEVSPLDDGCAAL